MKKYLVIFVGMIIYHLLVGTSYVIARNLDYTIVNESTWNLYCYGITFVVLGVIAAIKFLQKKPDMNLDDN